MPHLLRESQDTSGHEHGADGKFSGHGHHENLTSHGFKHAGTSKVNGTGNEEKKLHHYEKDQHKITIAPKGSWSHSVSGKVKAVGNPTNLGEHLHKTFKTTKTAESKTMARMPQPFIVQIRESFDAGSKLVVDRAAGIIRNVKVLGTSSPNSHGRRGIQGTDYLESSHRSLVSLMESRPGGVMVNKNHTERSNPNRDRRIDERLGWLKEPRVDAGETYATFYALDMDDPDTVKIFEAAAKNPYCFAMSIDADGHYDIDTKTNRLKIDRFSKVRSVDVVTDGGTTISLAESKDASGHEHAADGKFGAGGTKKTSNADHEQMKKAIVDAHAESGHKATSVNDLHKAARKKLGKDADFHNAEGFQHALGALKDSGHLHTNAGTVSKGENHPKATAADKAKVAKDRGDEKTQRKKQGGTSIFNRIGRALGVSESRKRKGHAMTLRESIEKLVTDDRTAHLFEGDSLLKPDPSAAPDAAPAPAVGDEAAADKPTWRAILADAIKAVLEDATMDEGTAKEKIEAILGALTGGTDEAEAVSEIMGGDSPMGGEDADGDGLIDATEGDTPLDESDDQGDDKEKKKMDIASKESKELQTLRTEKNVRRLCESLAFQPSELQIKAMAGLDDAERKTYIAELKGKAGAGQGKGGNPIRSGGPGSGYTRVNESLAPKTAADQAKLLLSNR